MTLQRIREATTEDEIITALEYLRDNCHNMTTGELHAISRTIRDTADMLGVDGLTLSVWWQHALDLIEEEINHEIGKQ